MLVQLVEEGEPSRFAYQAGIVALLVETDEGPNAQLNEQLLDELERRVELDRERRLESGRGST